MRRIWLRPLTAWRLLRRTSDKLAVVCTALCIVCTVVTVLVVAPTVLDTSRLTRENTQRTREVARLAVEIQRSRRESILSQCRETNRRHDDTIRALDRVLARAARTASPARLRDLQQRRAATVLLITALAPRQNCVARADRLVDPPPNP